jgi:hypothetical protein
MDIVAFTSSFTIDRQTWTAARLNEVVANTAAFKAAQASQSLISLPAGDGMALVFLNGMDAPLKCAIEIARALKPDPFCKLRMGIHSGLVIIGPDINGKPNVTGDGINLAQRVMSLGGDGHILISSSVADSLQNLTVWRDKLKYLGEFRAKKNWVRVWNLIDTDAGTNAPLHGIGRQTISRIYYAAAAVIILAGIYSFPYLKDAFDTMRLPERSLSYSLLVRSPAGQLAPLSPDAMVPAGSSIKMIFDSPEEGFLYLVAEGPATGAGKSWMWLFPEPFFHMGSAQVEANHSAEVPSDKDAFIDLAVLPGQETIHMIWTAKPAKEVEAVKTMLFERKSPELSAGEAAALATLIARFSGRSRETKRETRTRISGKDGVIVAEVTLGHM